MDVIVAPICNWKEFKTGYFALENRIVHQSYLYI